ncbi:DMT family transporter [bacterium]|nr:DMT family transporter [bacterium]
MKQRTLIISGAVFACLLWSTAFAGVKIGLRYMSPLLFAGLRFMISGLLLLPFSGRPAAVFRSLKAHWRIVLAVSFFQTLLLYLLFYTAMTRVSGALAAIVIGASPLISALTAHLLMPGDRMTMGKTASIIGGISGVVIISISRQPWSSAGLGEGLGILLLILSSLSSAVGNIIVARTRGAGLNPRLLGGAQLFLGGTGLFLLSLLLEEPGPLPAAPLFWAATAWLSFLSAAAFAIWFTLLSYADVKVSELNLWKFIIPVFGAAIAWLVLPDEQPSTVQALGMAIVSFSVFFYFRSQAAAAAAGTASGTRSS